jgi:hypothetical protein
MEGFWIVYVICAVVCGGLSSAIAEIKGQSSGGWFAAGLFFGIFGLIAAAGLPTKAQSLATTGLLKKCPDCAEAIRTEARVCKFCGLKFGQEEIVADLVEGLHDESVSNRLQALEAIRAIGDKSVVSQIVKFVDGLPVGNESNAQAQLLDEAAELLAELGSSAISADLVSVLKKTRSAIKAKKLVEVLVSLKDPSCIPALIAARQRPELRDYLTWALERFGQGALPGLEQLAKNGKRADRKFAEQIIDKIKASVPN